MGGGEGGKREGAKLVHHFTVSVLVPVGRLVVTMATAEKRMSNTLGGNLGLKPSEHHWKSALLLWRLRERPRPL